VEKMNSKKKQATFKKLKTLKNILKNYMIHNL